MHLYLICSILFNKDFHGTWESFTGHNAPLYSRANEKAEQEILNVDFAVKYWILKGAPKEKLVLGMGIN